MLKLTRKEILEKYPNVPEDVLMLKLTRKEILEKYPNVPEDVLNRVIRVGKNLDMTPEEIRKFLELTQKLIFSK